MPSNEVSPAPSPRQMRHLIEMCDGKRHCFLDHELAAEMRDLGWIERDCGDWRITEKGRNALERRSAPA